MSFTGAGTFVINSVGNPVVTGTTISSTWANALTADLATGLSTCVTKDGQTTPTANLPMGTFKLTGLGDGTAATDSINYGQAANLTGGSSYTTTATAAGTTTLTVASDVQQYFTGATTQTVTLPVTTTLYLGWSRRIINNSSGTVTVNSSGGNLVATVVANTQVTITCILLSGTAAASWDVKFSGTTATTGTGSGVRSVSPTLTTPNIGAATVTSLITSGAVTAAVYAAAGEITTPLQPCFLATANAQSNVTGDGTVYQVLYATEIFDQSGAFASSTFTASVTGRYHFEVLVYSDGGAGTSTAFVVNLVASNRTMLLDTKGASAFAGNNCMFGGGVYVDMDAADTATVTLTSSGGSKSIDIGTASSFSGALAA